MKYKVHRNDYFLFPYYYERNEYENIYELYIMGISINNIKDIIQKYSLNNIIIHDVALSTSDEEDIGDIAKKCNVNYKYFDNNCHIIINKNDFENIIDFDHYEYYLFDTENELNELDFFTFRNRTANCGDVAEIQNKLQYSNIWIYTHDDDWLYTESKKKEYIDKLQIRFFEILIKKYLKKFNMNEKIDIIFDKTFLNVLQNKNKMTIIKKCYKDDKYISFPITYNYFGEDKLKNLDVNKLDELIYDFKNKLLFIKINEK